MRAEWEAPANVCRQKPSRVKETLAASLCRVMAQNVVATALPETWKRSCLTSGLSKCSVQGLTTCL